MSAHPFQRAFWSDAARGFRAGWFYGLLFGWTVGWMLSLIVIAPVTGGWLDAVAALLPVACFWWGYWMSPRAAVSRAHRPPTTNSESP